MKKIIALLIFIISVPTFAATITAAAGGGNWSNTATWVGAATPTAADDVVLAVTSGSVTVDVGTALAKSVTATAFVNNLNFSAGQTLTVSGNVQLDTVVSGMTVSGTGVLAINATANLLSAGQTLTGTLYFPSNVTATMADVWTVSGDLITVAIATLNGNSINCGGSFKGTSTSSEFVGTTNINLNGSGTWSISVVASNALNASSSSVTINTSGTVTLGTIVYTGGTITYTSGTIVNTGSSIYLTGSCTLNTGTMHWNNIYCCNSAAGTYTITSNLNLDGTLFFGYAVVNPPLSPPVNQTFSGAFNTSVSNLQIDSFVRGRFSAGQTITVSKSISMFHGGTGTITFLAGARFMTNPVLASATASSSIFLKYTGDCQGSLIFNGDFTDVDASVSSSPLTVYSSDRGPTLTRTTNIVTGTYTASNCAGGGAKGFY